MNYYAEVHLSTHFKIYISFQLNLMKQFFSETRFIKNLDCFKNLL